ncbi:MAG: PilZ domain-containing protein [bacterium]
MGGSRATSSGAEQRRAVRAPLCVPAVYRLVHDDGRATAHVDAEAMNVSLLGAMLTTDQLETDGISLLPPMEPEPLTRLDIELALDGAKGAIAATGRVVWVRRSAAGARRRFTIGVVFSYLDAESQTRLRAFLEGPKTD